MRQVFPRDSTFVLVDAQASIDQIHHLFERCTYPTVVEVSSWELEHAAVRRLMSRNSHRALRYYIRPFSLAELLAV